MTRLAPLSAISAFAFLLACRIPVYAQFNTPVIDGSIGSGEYGNTTNGTNQIGTNTTQTWYMTWDATNLYVAVANANLSEAAVLYIAPNPVNPPNGGTNANGSLTGFNYDGEEVASLPFRAKFVTYFKDGYNEYRNSDGNGGWTGNTSNYGSYASNGNGNVREFAIPWSAITNGGSLPSSFLFLGLVTSNGGYVYGQVPNDNGGGQIGTSAAYTQYFVVNTTANGSSTPPFSNENSSSGVSYSGLYHNTFDPYFRSQEGAVSAGSTVTLRFQTAHFGATGVNLRVYLFDTGSGNTTGPFDSPMAFLETRTFSGNSFDEYTIDYTTPTTPTIVYYKFVVTNGGSTAFYSDDYIDDYDNLNKDGSGTATSTEPLDSFQITAYDPNFQTPAWVASANIYQIFPDRFRNGDPTNDYCVAGSTSGCPSFYGAPSSGNIAVTTWNTQLCDPNNSNLPCYNNFSSIFYGGDLLGIQNELDYIQGLGFDTIYLTPIFQASSNHRYDTDDFLNVDPALGGNAALASLLNAMNQRGMRAIFDGVWNHASSDSTYFNEYNRFSTLGACQSLSSPFRTWFHFSDDNVPCTPADYPAWDGFSSLPTFDHTQTAVQNFFYATPGSVMQTWYAAGASGWRFDVAPDPNFPHSWWVGTRQFGKGYKSDGPLIGEIWPNASQWLAGDQMDSTMNYRFRRNVTGFVRYPNGFVDNNDNGNDSIIPLSPSQFDTAMRAIRDDYPPQATAAMMDLIDSHDTNRALFVMTETGDTGLVQAKQRLELAALFQFTYIGAPTVFYGDEAGINAPSLFNSSSGPVGDPYCRAPYPWSDQPGDPTVYGPADTSVISFYTTLGHLRKQHPSLVSGTFATLLTGDTQQASTAPTTYAFARSLSATGGETAVVALNNGSATNNATIPVGAYYPDGTNLQDALAGGSYTVNGGNVTVSLNPISGVVLLPYPAAVDLVPPTASINPSPAANGAGWNNSLPVTVGITGMDDSSGVSQIIYWVDGGTPTSVAGSSASTSIASAGQHTVGVRVIDNAGNISQQYLQTVNIDVTAPTSTATPSSSPNGAGWYNAPVTINFSAIDDASGSGVAQIQYSLSGAQTGSQTISGSTGSVTISTSGSTTVTYFSVDVAGNTETSHTLTVNVDTTSPVVSPTVTGTLGANGWYVSNVSVTWNVSDSFSGIASSTGCGAVNLTQFTAGTTITCSATSVTGATSSNSVTIKLDSSAPVIVPNITGTAGTNGWYTATVNVTWSVSDPNSGVASMAGCSPVTLSTYTAGTVLSCSATSVSGVSNSASVTIMLDPRAPTIVPTVTGTLGAGGWYISDVNVTWSVTQTQSGVASSSGCTPTTLNAYTAGTTLTCSATSVAGLTNSNSVTVMVDLARIHTLDKTSLKSVFVTASLSVHPVITVNGEVFVDSVAPKALYLEKGATMSATAVDVVGGYFGAANAVTPKPVTGATSRPDPLLSLAEPHVGACGFHNYSISSGSATLTPGVYCGGITISNATVTFNPGLYILSGGGLNIMSGTVTGSGVTFYNTYTASRPFGPILTSAVAQVSLSAQTSGPLANVLFFEDRRVTASPNTPANTLEGNSNTQLYGTLYFPKSRLVFSGGNASNTGPTVIIADKVYFDNNTNLQ